MRKKGIHKKLDKWDLYEKLYKKSKAIDSINYSTIIDIVANMNEKNTKTFLYIILHYQKKTGKKTLVGRHIIGGSKYSLNTTNYPDKLLKILLTFCIECGTK